MKRNAILIASIMFAAGCATKESNYRTSSSYSPPPPVNVSAGQSTELVARTPQGELIPPSDPSLSAQYDPAMGSAGTSVTGTMSSDQVQHRNNLNVSDYHADSSVPGGSNEARGWSTRDHLPTEGTAQPIDPAVQADSSIRGGSSQARQTDWYRPSNMPTAAPGNHVKADSSIRGGSNEARGYTQSSSQLQPSPDDSMVNKNTHFEYLSDRDALGQGKSINKDTSLLGSSNWNAADDMLPDGTESIDLTQMANESAGNTATSQRASATSSATATSSRDLDTPATASVAIDSSNSLASPGSRKDLNGSKQLEKDLSGQYDITRQSGTSSHLSAVPDTALETQGSSTAVGGPGSTETGSASSGTSNTSRVAVDANAASGADVTDSTHGGYSLFQNNRAQGVGSAASGVSGAAASENFNVPTVGDNDLASNVKSILMRETTGTAGVTQREVARNIQVTSRNGDITLSGMVPDQKAKDVIEIRAREIAGVHKVHNNLKVEPKSDARFHDVNLGRDLEDSTDQLHNVQPPQ